MSTPGRQAHWEGVYTNKAENEVSWYQETPDVSLGLISGTGLGVDAAIIDIGAGASRLIEALLDRGFRSVSALDLSEAALETTRARLGARADSVEWIVSDVTAWRPAKRYDIWHDRAAFHFLTEAADRADYLRVLELALRPGGFVLIATFAADGPEKCSGLPVVRYEPDALARALGPAFVPVESRREIHTTPWASTQAFQFSLFRYGGRENMLGGDPK